MQKYEVETHDLENVASAWRKAANASNKNG
jgi:hypothetical protein